VIEKDNRPVNLNLLRINLPIIGLASILHRISGFALFICFPLVVWLLHISLNSTESFDQLNGYLENNTLLKIMIVLIATGFIYHVFAGLKKILGEIFGFGQTLKSGQVLSWLIFALSFTCSFWFLVYIW
jgi:succinate dehydrogenase / fumarate reductase cytochrome b subunit|tara:strand:+ start:8429 stop:8815 length:387 start_codon:yes stop_codon:yes gene_type:complete